MKKKIVEFHITPEYQVVYTPADGVLQAQAQVMQQYFKEVCGVALETAGSDSASSDRQILLTVDDSLPDGDYRITLKNGNLSVRGGHSEMVKKAVLLFTRNSKAGTAYLAAGSTDFSAHKDGGYEYVWGDEFDGDTLDRTKWDRYNRMTGTAELRIDNTSEDIVRTEDGMLKLFARKTAANSYVAPASVSTKDTMSFQHGYIEIRAKLPFGTGLWPSFWFSSNLALGSNTSADYTIEVDMFEVFARNDRLCPNIHKWYYDGRHTQYIVPDKNYIFEDPSHLSDEYHVYGLEWTEDEISTYVDGVKYYTYDLNNNFDGGSSGMAGFDTTLSIIINNHLFTAGSTYKPYEGCEIENAEYNLPAEYFIDWVRLYQKEGSILHTAE